MKKFIMNGLLACISLMVLPMLLTAQESRQQRFERIEAEKVAFITKELELTSREAQRFFPAYNEYRKEIYALIQQSRRRDAQGKRRQQTRVDELELEAKLLAVKKKYRQQFSEIIGSARGSRFFEVEREFREKLMQELRRRGN